MTFFYIAASLIVVAAIFHSVQGERLLIRPTLAVDDPFIRRPMTQAIIRFGWHASSLFMLMTAILIVWPGTPVTLILLPGLLWLTLGVTNLLMTKAKHPGGSILSLIGVIILAGYSL